MQRPLAVFLLTLKVSVVLAAVAPNTLAREDPTFATIDFPGATSTLALDISPTGEIVGSYNDANGSTHGCSVHSNRDHRRVDQRCRAERRPARRRASANCRAHASAAAVLRPRPGRAGT